MPCKATWNGQIVAESDACIITEGTLYFPPDSVRQEFLKPSDRRYHCIWKGDAGYYNLVSGDATVKDAAWHYDKPSKAAEPLKDYVASDEGLGVTVEGSAKQEIKRPW
ncbi:DUF427 domain-containing protein [Dehalogenimonas sp. THU2]|uniref:DUF427 domain-containing protein n=1 Tax=Dehalogenimonas sp. THU2 TaxID=3151121 RepID=UPI003218C135